MAPWHLCYNNAMANAMAPWHLPWRHGTMALVLQQCHGKCVTTPELTPCHG